MASIFKRSRDKKRRQSYWYVSYDDENGRRRMKKGFTDRRATVELAEKLEREVRRRKEGLVDPDEERRRDARTSPIDTHLNDFEKSLAKNTSKHVKLTMSRVRRIVYGCEMRTLKELTAQSVEAFLLDFQSEEDLGHKTYNHYLQAVDSFCNWLVSRRLVIANPLVGIARQNTEADVRRQRRALSIDEFDKLLDSARMSNLQIQCFDGEQRARIYTLSFLTGLRRKEIASLSKASFQLDAIPPTLTVEAACSKHRRKDVLPLHPELVEVLGKWLQDIPPGEPLFPKLAKRRTWLMVKKDLERVGIPYKTDKGVADFHAAGRHTHITELLRSGASLTEARELARHSDIRMTMRYTHIGIDDQAKAVSRLPWQRDGNNDSNPQAASDGHEEAWHRSDSGKRHPNGHLVASAGTEKASRPENPKNKTPYENGVYGAACRDVAPSGIEDASVEAAGIEPGFRFWTLSDGHSRGMTYRVIARRFIVFRLLAQCRFAVIR